MVAAQLDELRRNQNSASRFQPVDQVERQRLARQAQDVQRYRQQRQNLEASTVRVPAATGAFAPARVTLPRSPIVARPVTQLGRNYAPPKTYAAPNPDPGGCQAASESNAGPAADSHGKPGANRAAATAGQQPNRRPTTGPTAGPAASGQPGRRDRSMSNPRAKAKTKRYYHFLPFFNWGFPDEKPKQVRREFRTQLRRAPFLNRTTKLKTPFASFSRAAST